MSDPNANSFQTVFGMNLFVFDASTRQIVIAKDFWVFVVIFLPLTAVTLFAWTLLKRRADKIRAEKTRGTISLF